MTLTGLAGRVRGSGSPVGVCRATFCHGDMFYTTVFNALHTYKLVMLVV